MCSTQSLAGELQRDVTSFARHVRGAERIGLLLLGLAVITYVCVFLRFTFDLYDRFALWVYDLAIFDQATWLISRGHTPFVTVRGLHLLADHFSLILYPLAPLYWLWDSPKVLLAIQTIALAMGALPVYALALRRTESAFVAEVFGVAYLLYPAVQWTNATEFHPESFATPFLLGAFYFLICKKWGWYFILLGLAALTKESVGLIILALGVYAMVVHPRVGWLTIGSGALALCISMGTITYFNGGASSSYYSLYAKYGGNPFEMVSYLILHPIAVTNELNSAVNRQYMTQMLQPLLFLPLLAPEVLLIALPALLLNLLSVRGEMRTIYYHYTTFITPFVFPAAIIGFERWRRWGNRVTTGAVLLFLSIGMAQSTKNSPLLSQEWQRPPQLSVASAQETRAILSRIPSDASVSAQVALITSLGHRPQVFMFPNPFYAVATGHGVQALRQQYGKDYPVYDWSTLNQAINNSTVEYVTLCPPTSTFPLSPIRYPHFAAAILENGTFGIIDIGQDTVLLRRGADHQRGLRLLEEKAGVTIVDKKDIRRAFHAWIANQPGPL